MSSEGPWIPQTWARNKGGQPPQWSSQISTSVQHPFYPLGGCALPICNLEKIIKHCSHLVVPCACARAYASGWVTAPSSVAEGNLQRPTALPVCKVGIQKARLPHWVNLPYRDEKTLMVGKIEGRRRRGQ